jgi:Domain of unknown function (DUF4276)
MNVGIVVEGQNDLAAYPRLIQRIRNDINAYQLRQCGGKSRLKHGFINFLKEFQRNPAWNIDVAFVIRDSDCNPPQPIEEQLEDILEASAFTPEFPVEFFATSCMLESWLLSDLDAIRTVAAQRGHVAGVLHPNIQITNAPSSADKAVFIKVLTSFGLPATPPVYGEVSSLMNFTTVRNRCNYFGEFMRRASAV